MTDKIIHEEVRREIDNYVNHAKALGFNTEGYASFSAYCQLIHEIIIISDLNNKKGDDDE